MPAAPPRPEAVFFIHCCHGDHALPTMQELHLRLWFLSTTKTFYSVRFYRNKIQTWNFLQLIKPKETQRSEPHYVSETKKLGHKHSTFTQSELDRTIESYAWCVFIPPHDKNIPLLKLIARRFTVIVRFSLYCCEKLILTSCFCVIYTDCIYTYTVIFISVFNCHISNVKPASVCF